MRNLILALLLLGGTSFAQQVNSDIIPANSGLNLGRANQPWNGFFQNLTVQGQLFLKGGSFMGLPCIATAATLGTKCGSLAGTVASVTDGLNSSDCTVGGGGSANACLYNGTTWIGIGATSVAGTANQIINTNNVFALANPLTTPGPVIIPTPPAPGGSAYQCSPQTVAIGASNLDQFSCWTDLLGLDRPMWLDSTNSDAQEIVTMRTQPSGLQNGQGLGWLAQGNGGKGDFEPQSKPVIDARDYGVKGDGINDDTTALQAAVNAACGSPFSGHGSKLVLSPSSFNQIKISNTITFRGCWGITFDGQGQTGTALNTLIFWAGAAGGTMFKLDQVRDSTFENFTLTTQTGPGASAANIALDIGEFAPLTSITTHNHYENIQVSQPNNINASFIGVRLGTNGPGNSDQETFENIQVTCAPGTLPSGSTTQGIGILVDGTTSQPFYIPFHNTNMVGCSKGWDIKGNNVLVVIDGGLFNNNYWIVHYEGGSLLELKNARDEGSNTALMFGANAVDATVDHMSFSGLTPGNTTIDMTTQGGSGSKIYVYHSVWDNVAVTPISVNAGGSSRTVLDYNVYPNGKCPVLTSFGGVAHDLYSVTYNAQCNTFLGSQGGTVPYVFGVAATQVLNSGPLQLCGSYQNTGTPTFLPECYTQQVFVGSGTNGATRFGFSHTGSTAQVQYDFPLNADITQNGGATTDFEFEATGVGFKAPVCNYNTAQTCLTFTTGKIVTTGTDAAKQFGFGTSKGEHFVTFAANNDHAGTCTASAATTCTVTFTTSYTVAPACTVTDQTNIIALKALPSTTNLVITTTGASSDVFSYICVGNPN